MSKFNVNMNDATIQHHFDEVFLALQDVENFEIFSKMKKGCTPRIHRTLVKLVESSDEDNTSEKQNDIEEQGSVSKFGSQLKNLLNRSSNNTPIGTPSNSRPSSRSSTIRKFITTPSKLKMTLTPSTNLYTTSESTKSSGVKKVFSSTLMQREKSVEMRNTLFQCKFCGRFILGDFLEVHEENCGNESL